MASRIGEPCMLGARRRAARSEWSRSSCGADRRFDPQPREDRV